MKLVSFNFNKINIERFSDSYKNIKLNTKINILNIEQIESPLLKEEDIIKVKFLYFIEYLPGIARIDVGGEIILSVEKRFSKNIIDGWKDKKMSEEFRILVFNLILKKANIKALELEDQLNLPLHIPMPSIKKGKKE